MFFHIIFEFILDIILDIICHVIVHIILYIKFIIMTAINYSFIMTIIPITMGLYYALSHI